MSSDKKNELKWYMDATLIEMMLSPIVEGRNAKVQQLYETSLQKYQEAWNIIKAEIEGIKDTQEYIEQIDENIQFAKSCTIPSRKKNRRLRMREDSKKVYDLKESLNNIELILFRAMKKSPLWLKYSYRDDRPGVLQNDDD